MGLWKDVNGTVDGCLWDCRNMSMGLPKDVHDETFDQCPKDCRWVSMSVSGCLWGDHAGYPRVFLGRWRVPFYRIYLCNARSCHRVYGLLCPVECFHGWLPTEDIIHGG